MNRAGDGMEPNIYLPDALPAEDHPQIADLAVKPDSELLSAGDVERCKKGRNSVETRPGRADLAALHIAMGVTVRMFWDIQKTKTATTNRLAMMDRDYPEMPRTALEAVAAELTATEHGLELQIRGMVRQHPMRAWIDQAPGIGYASFAGLIALTGSLDRFATVSKLWKYLGLHVQNGHAPRSEKGVPWTHTNCQGGHRAHCDLDCKTDHHPLCKPDGFGTAYAARGRVICFQIGESIAKLKKGNGPYRTKYDEQKAAYEIAGWGKSQNHRHQSAKRIAVKALVRDMWVEWQCQCVSGAQRGPALLDPQTVRKLVAA